MDWRSKRVERVEGPGTGKRGDFVPPGIASAAADIPTSSVGTLLADFPSSTCVSSMLPALGELAKGAMSKGTGLSSRVDFVAPASRAGL